MKTDVIRAGLVLAICAALAGCGGAVPASAPAALPSAAPERPALAPQPVPPALAALAGRTRACDAASGAPAGPPNASDAEVVASSAVIHYDDSSNTIELRAGARATLTAIDAVIARPDVLKQVAPGEWLLAANLRVGPGAALRIAAPEARWLKLQSDANGFIWLKALGGQVDVDDACVSSWNAARGAYDEDVGDGRGFILARDGGRLAIHRSDLRYLGYNGSEAYGVSWRLAGTTGEIVDSFISHNFYGLYTYQVDDLVIRGNEAFENVMYGIDPHTQSNRLVIENNVAHDNGKHGIILAEECSDGVIRGNVAYDNLHHGIVVYQHSNNNLIEGNVAYGNGGHGINVNDSTNTIVRGNTVYDNLEAGIGVGQRAVDSQVVGNQVFANRRDGVTLYSDARGTALRENRIADNARYGLYIKSEGGAQVQSNRVTGNAVGVYLVASRPPDISPDANTIQSNREADLRQGAPPAGAEEEPNADQ